MAGEGRLSSTAAGFGLALGLNWLDKLVGSGAELSWWLGMALKDFFISYTSADQRWAEWIAWQLEGAGLTTIIQAWDFRAGSNFVLDMNQASTQAARTIAVLSPDYFAAKFTPP